MLQRLKNQKGFTLVELMVVLLIIGILIAVAVPVFLGARARSQNNVANQTVTNSARGVAAEYAGNSPNALPTVAEMNAAEPAYTWQVGVSTGPTVVQYIEGTGVVSVLSDDGGTSTGTVAPANGVVTLTLL